MVASKGHSDDYDALRAFIIEHDPIIVVSSDFCHYGPAYGYQIGADATSDDIKALDMKAFDAISSKDPWQFTDYLLKTGNTICGRNAISLMMELIRDIYPDGEWRLLAYDQSSQVKSSFDSSVSYLAAGYFL